VKRPAPPFIFVKCQTCGCSMHVRQGEYEAGQHRYCLACATAQYRAFISLVSKLRGAGL